MCRTQQVIDSGYNTGKSTVLCEPEIRLDSRLWIGSFNGRESSLHQLSPYVGKLKSGMVRVLLRLYSSPGDVVLDPFCGSGVVPLESLLLGRRAWANDLSVYAYTITRGKLSAPPSVHTALANAVEVADECEKRAASVDLSCVPDWVQSFFHPKTLCEIIVAFQILYERSDYFLMACLLGILHHVRPGFLSYPASHLTPYLRKSKYPPAQFPDMYGYRDVRSRLLAKVQRAYRRVDTIAWSPSDWMVTCDNSMALRFADASVDSIISSPPYFGALDYARDNRLRLWFLGITDWKELDEALTANDKVYLPQMRLCLAEMNRVLRPGACCVLVLGDVYRNGRTRNTAEIIAKEAEDVTKGQLRTEMIYTDEIPDDRRSRRNTRTTKYERILVMQKSSK
ncbi:MAG: hypothetical protein HYX78_07525 [Armatimonadetes bacterium]|nr:hypothetical protein [Armatimonadota bacterium]